MRLSPPLPLSLSLSLCVSLLSLREKGGFSLAGLSRKMRELRLSNRVRVEEREVIDQGDFKEA